MANIAFFDMPMRAINPECLARRRVNLYKANVIKTGLLQAEGLTTCASAYFYRGKPH
jgi:hypothetical protein